MATKTVHQRIPPKGKIRKEVATKDTAAIPAVALHAKAKHGDGHIVGLLGLRVVLIEEDGAWFAQGIDIDYLAQGDDIEDAKKQFEVGLTATVELHLKKFRGIQRLLRVAPVEVQRELDTKIGMCYSQVTSHAIPA